MLRRAGFTILEILIAIVVLVLGITGIIALFPTAIESGNKTVEDSYAAAITQSVVDAITVGVRESRYTYRATTVGRTYTYFVFNHDGVIDQPPLDPATFDKVSTDDASDDYSDKHQGAIWRRDFCVILPQGPSGNKTIGAEPNFMYPVPSYVADDANESAKDADQYGLNQRSPTRLNSNTPLTDNLSLNFLRPSATVGEQVPWISRTYHLGRYRMPLGSTNGGTTLPNGPDGVKMNPGDIRVDYLGDAVSTGGTSKERTIALDPYPSYSFCFTLQRARIDTWGPGAGNTPDGRLTPDDQFSDTLYTLRVRIYKNFDRQAALDLKPGNPADEASAPTGGTQAVPRSNIHIREFVTLIAL